MQEKDGKYIFGVVKVGDKGQVVIPRDARKLYGIQPGDALIVLGDQRGMALLFGRVASRRGIGIADVYILVAEHFATESGDGQAPFPSGNGLSAGGGDPDVRIDFERFGVGSRGGGSQMLIRR